MNETTITQQRPDETELSSQDRWLATLFLGLGSYTDDYIKTTEDTMDAYVEVRASVLIEQTLNFLADELSDERTPVKLLDEVKRANSAPFDLRLELARRFNGSQDYNSMLIEPFYNYINEKYGKNASDGIYVGSVIANIREAYDREFSRFQSELAVSTATTTRPLGETTMVKNINYKDDNPTAWTYSDLTASMIRMGEDLGDVSIRCEQRPGYTTEVIWADDAEDYLDTLRDARDYLTEIVRQLEIQVKQGLPTEDNDND